MNIETFTDIAAPLGVLGVKITQNDRLTAEWYSEPDIRRNIYSATKSFTSCAVGFAVQEGLLSLDEKLVDAFPEDLPDTVSENLAKSTVRGPADHVSRRGEAAAHGGAEGYLPKRRLGQNVSGLSSAP